MENQGQNVGTVLAVGTASNFLSETSMFGVEQPKLKAILNNIQTQELGQADIFANCSRPLVVNRQSDLKTFSFQVLSRIYILTFVKRMGYI